MPRLLCMKRPKLAIRDVAKTSTVKNGTMSLPGLGKFSVTPTHHHPLCPSSDAPKYLFFKLIMLFLLKKSLDNFCFSKNFFNLKN